MRVWIIWSKEHLVSKSNNIKPCYLDTIYRSDVSFLRYMGIYFAIFSNVASIDEITAELEVWFSELDVVHHSIDGLKKYIKACHETGINKEKANELWETKIHLLILPGKSSVSILQMLPVGHM